jgi:microcystin-dependent protein
MTGYLTPDAPAPIQYVYRRVRIPNDEQLIANVAGALAVLSFPENWTPQGTMTPDTAADIGGDILDDFMLMGDFMPVATLFPFASAVVPAHCLECDGATYNRMDYPALYAALDAAFLVDLDHFRVPDMRGNVAMGSDFGTGITYPVGATGGEATHVLGITELAVHTHIDSGHVHPEGNSLPVPIPQGVGVPIPSAVPSVGVTGIGSAILQPAGGGLGHNNLQPYLALRYAIVSE